MTPSAWANNPWVPRKNQLLNLTTHYNKRECPRWRQSLKSSRTSLKTILLNSKRIRNFPCDWWPFKVTIFSINSVEVPESTVKGIYKLTYSDGSCYIGYTNSTKKLRQGQGTMFNTDGKSYSGYWVNDKILSEKDVFQKEEVKDDRNEFKGS